MQSETQTGNIAGHRTLAEPVPLEQVLRVAELAQLELTPDEQQEMLRDLNAILGHVAQLNELNTADVPPMTQVKDAIGANSETGKGADPSGNVLRDDNPRPSLNRLAALAAAPETDGTYFKVPKVIER